MIIEVLKNNTFEDPSNLPAAATSQSSGYDIFATQDPEIVGEYDEKNEVYTNVTYIQYKTNLKMWIKSHSIVTGMQRPETINYDILAFPRSSISKYNLTLANSIGLIDQDYQGEVLLRFKYIWQPEDYVIIDGKLGGKVNFDKIYRRGDKIAQLKPTRRESANFILVNSFDETTERGSGGFGHTDNKIPINTSSKNVPTIKTLYDQFGDPSTKPKTYIEQIKEREL